MRWNCGRAPSCLCGEVGEGSRRIGPLGWGAFSATQTKKITTMQIFASQLLPFNQGTNFTVYSYSVHAPLICRHVLCHRHLYKWVSNPFRYFTVLELQRITMATVAAAPALTANDSHKKYRIQVSNTKKPLFFYVNLAKVIAFLCFLKFHLSFFPLRTWIWSYMIN